MCSGTDDCRTTSAKPAPRLPSNAFLTKVVVVQVGDIRGYSNVRYHPDAIAITLSLSGVQRRYKVTYNSEQGEIFTFHKAYGTICEFKLAAQRLYALQTIVPHVQVAIVSTVVENEKSFTRRERKEAKEAQGLIAIIGRPSDA